MKIKLTLYLSLFLQGGLSSWTNICQNGFHAQNDCCKMDINGVDMGMERHEYEVMTDKRDYDDQRSSCVFQSITDPTHNYQLVTLESRKEYTCVMKWLLKEKGNFGPFYIGLKADSSDFMKNFFEWEFPIRLEDSVMSYTAWAPAAPRGAGDCVYSQVGETLSTNGLWFDNKCTDLLPSICERYPK